ncbi:peptidoglycan-binding domain-containing protein, partial [Halochromatium glycolicum]|uniref:peptidoglycan-binding domain-containing protein n=1 Tax=Halochromatium glycolicum TaxID=85075 RepID=UPI00190B2B41
NGVFTFGIPRPGIWGFACLGSGPDKEHKGKELSQDAVLWINVSSLGNGDSTVTSHAGTAPAQALTVTSETVEALQAASRAQGFNPGPIDGLLGPRTTAAIKDFQRDRGLRVTGKLDAELAQQLGIR